MRGYQRVMFTETLQSKVFDKSLAMAIFEGLMMYMFAQLKMEQNNFEHVFITASAYYFIM